MNRHARLRGQGEGQGKGQGKGQERPQLLDTAESQTKVQRSSPRMNGVGRRSIWIDSLEPEVRAGDVPTPLPHLKSLCECGSWQ